MSYWIKRILLKSGELVTERELSPGENSFDGPIPVVGDRLQVCCRGRRFEAEVVWGNWLGREHASGVTVPLRVQEV
jgi:hypothetical protein